MIRQEVRDPPFKVSQLAPQHDLCSSGTPPGVTSVQSRNISPERQWVNPKFYHQIKKTFLITKI